MSKDYYKILDVSREASEEEVKKAFKQKALKYHPDREGGDEDKFKEASEAYQVLSNKEKRAQYDQFGSEAPFGGGAGAGGNPYEGFSGFGGGPQGFDIDLEDILGDFFGRRKRSQQNTKQGEDIEVDVRISFA